MFKLKSKLIVAVMVILGITAFMSCEKGKVNSEEITENKYSELALLVKSGLEDIGENLREQKSTFNSRDIVILSAAQHFSGKPKVFDAFLTEYDKSFNKSQLKSNIYNEVINSVKIGRAHV